MTSKTKRTPEAHKKKRKNTAGNTSEKEKKRKKYGGKHSRKRKKEEKYGGKKMKRVREVASADDWSIMLSAFSAEI